MSSPPIQWYPGHIAKAEQQLRRHLDKVDLVIEVRDARIPLATGHPHLSWVVAPLFSVHATYVDTGTDLKKNC